VPVAELVLWIGYLKWHFRTRGRAPPAVPVLRDFRNIRECDALLTYDRAEPEHLGAGVLKIAGVTQWLWQLSIKRASSPVRASGTSPWR
jgi:hypothetical protein